MGINDLMRLFPIVQYLRKQEKIHNWGYVFNWDQGCRETWIGIHKETGSLITSEQAGKMPDIVLNHYQQFVPDILDFNMRAIIEIEETYGKPKHGAKLAKKGHDPDGLDKRTSTRDFYYEMAGFEVYKVFDFMEEAEWNISLKRFLIENFFRQKERIKLS